ncbi:hypothetical protein [Peptoniphilus sp. BV3C26]|uniref:hypothetical protein n=1 Tax=Peptoniphilus sp. BV3C26 TaxID=1111134 RepID=UPI0003B8129F|nr:hypothetical protein [Peptoniphilus sp. BV3C26]ERT57747.1 hypothetical protein HMPREF1253_0393 [Peptoniphilus sp. BV3C26]
MAAEKGWVSIHRSIYDNWIWNDDEEFDKRSAWIDLLLMVNHEDKKVLIDGILEMVKRGQRITSIRKLCTRWRWSRTKVNNFLKLLEKDNMIQLKIEPHKKTVITIVNYNFYQDDNKSKKASEEPVKDQPEASEEPVKSLNNNERIMINNDNNDDDEIYILNILEQSLNKKISQSSVKKLIKNFGRDNVKLLAEKISESTWLKENVNINQISKKFFNSITEDKYKDYEKKEVKDDNRYDWYKPLEL